MLRITRTRWVFVFLSLALSEACHRQPNLTPRLILESEHVGRDSWLGAPYIAVVKIIHADLQGARQSLFQGGPKSLQLVRFDAQVENTIRGEFPSDTISFYFFAYLAQKHDYYLNPGKHYIVSLRSEGGVLRSFADGTQLNIEVYSGSHSQKDLPLELGPEAVIAYVRLTPGVDVDLDNFQRHLDGTWGPSDGSPKYVYERLRILQTNSNPALRDAACVATALMFGQHAKCLQQAKHSAEASIRHTASESLGYDDPSLLRQLKSDPLSLLPAPWAEYAPQMLEIYADDTRLEVHKVACTSLRNLAPEKMAEHCEK